MNSSVGVVVAPRGNLLLALDLAITNGQITEINSIFDPARLSGLDLAVLDD